MFASALLGVLAALALSAQAEVPSSAPEARVVEARASSEAVKAPVPLSLQDQAWLSTLEEELRVITPADLLVDGELGARLLARSENLEGLFAREQDTTTDSQLRRIESHLLRLGIWRSPAR